MQVVRRVIERISSIQKETRNITTCSKLCLQPDLKIKLLLMANFNSKQELIDYLMVVHQNLQILDSNL